MRTQRSGQSALLLLDVVDILEQAQTGYAVIGALAASVHGAVRASMDADLVLSTGTQELGALKHALEAAGFDTVLNRGGFDDPIPAMLRLNDVHGNRVDLLAGIRGLEPAAFSRTVDIPFQGRTLHFIGREDFIAMKTFAGGPQDLVDAARALAAAGQHLDMALLQRLCRRYGSDAAVALEKLLNEQ